MEVSYKTQSSKNRSFTKHGHQLLLFFVTKYGNMVRTYLSVEDFILSWYFLSTCFNSFTRVSHFSLKFFLSSIN